MTHSISGEGGFGLWSIRVLTDIVTGKLRGAIDVGMRPGEGAERDVPTVYFYVTPPFTGNRAESQPRPPQPPHL